MNFVSTSPFEVSASTFMGGFSGEPVAAMVEFDLRPLKPGRDYAGVNYIAEEPLHVDGEAIREEYGGRMSGNLAFVGEMHLRKDTAPKIKRITLHVLDSKRAKLTSFRKESVCTQVGDPSRHKTASRLAKSCLGSSGT